MNRISRIRLLVVGGSVVLIELACRLAWNRIPHADELEAARRIGGDDLTTWTAICRALFGSADFLFLN